jgi:hypothetical protein
MINRIEGLKAFNSINLEKELNSKKAGLKPCFLGISEPEKYNFVK